MENKENKTIIRTLRGDITVLDNVQAIVRRYSLFSRYSCSGIYIRQDLLQLPD